MKINLVMIVKNEARSLKKCLELASHLVDGIIIADTGSQDQTRLIAEEMGAEVVVYHWVDDFSAARNYVLQYSGADWNLVLDADEYLRPCSRGELEAAIGRIEKRHGTKWLGALTRYDSFRDEEGISVSASAIPRLLPKGVGYAGPIHEQPDSEYPCIVMPLSADHDGYLNGDKGERNLPYLESAVKTYPADGYYQFQLGATLRNLKRYEESLPWFRQFYAGSSAKDGYRTEGILLYLYTLLDTGTSAALEEALIITEKEKSSLGERADFCFVCGLFYMKLVLSDVAKYIAYLPLIESSYLRCLSIGEKPEQGGVIGTGSFKAAYNLGLWYEVSGQRGLAGKYYKVSAEAGYEPAVMRLKILK